PDGCLSYRNEGSLLDADHPANGVLFARRFTTKVFEKAGFGRHLVRINTHIFDYDFYDPLGDITHMISRV
ncbi:hypothetical protein, partial [Sphingobium olei]